MPPDPQTESDVRHALDSIKQYVRSDLKPPAKAYLSDKGIHAATGKHPLREPAPFYLPDEVRAATAAATEQAWALAVAEAREAVAGIEAAGQKIAHRHRGWEQGMGGCVCEAHLAWDKALADWNKFVEGGNG